MERNTEPGKPKPRKKICPKCGRKLWLRDFYRLGNGSLYPRCKECTREDKKDSYERTRKKKDGVYQAADGRLRIHSGRKTSIFWSQHMIDTLNRKFPTTRNEDLAVILNVSPRTLIRKARELGLQKNCEWQRLNSQTNVRLAILTNKVKRNSGMFRKGERRSPDTEFKPKNSQMLVKPNF